MVFKPLQLSVLTNKFINYLFKIFYFFFKLTEFDIGFRNLLVIKLVL